MASNNKSQSNPALPAKSISRSETGHAKNVANFGKLVSFCSGYGADYNPSNSDISLEALTIILSSSQEALSSVNSILPAFSMAVAERYNTFKPLKRVITRIINALKAASPNPAFVKVAITLARKLQGRRASAKLSEEEKQKLAEKGVEVIEISSSQLSFDNRINNFDKLVKLIASIPEYNPNETDLKVSSLTSLLEDFRAKNKAVVDTAVLLSNARIARNNLLYNDNGGLIYKAMSVKAYVKSIFGASSSQYHQISGLTFRQAKI